MTTLLRDLHRYVRVLFRKKKQNREQLLGWSLKTYEIILLVTRFKKYAEHS